MEVKRGEFVVDLLALWLHALLLILQFNKMRDCLK